MTDPAAGLAETLDEIVAAARELKDGQPATYIPELARADPALTSVAVRTVDGRLFEAGDAAEHRMTLQSSAKVALLAALVEELGEEQVFSKVGTEPSGSSFASIARLETHGPLPANPLVNAGAIVLCSLVPGNLEERLRWLDAWIERLYGELLPIDARVLESERQTADRNRAIAHYLRSLGHLEGPVDEVLQLYFTLCSYLGRVAHLARFGQILAACGRDETGREILGETAVEACVALMATCGLYDESGDNLLRTGLPAKSGVSGVILAVAPARAGIAVASPLVNARGNSVRGRFILERLSRRMGWHLARAVR